MTPEAVEELLFPISPDVVNRVTDRFIADPALEIDKAAASLKSTNQGLLNVITYWVKLLSGLSSGSGRSYVGPDNIACAGYFTYAFLNEQANSCLPYGISLPSLPEDYAHVLNQDMRAEVAPGEKMRAFILRKRDEFEVLEPDLGRVMRIINLFNDGRVEFYEGAFNVYYSVRHYLNAKQFSQFWDFDESV